MTDDGPEAGSQIYTTIWRFHGPDPDPDPFRIRFGVATREVRIRFGSVLAWSRIRFGSVSDPFWHGHSRGPDPFRIRFGSGPPDPFRIRIRIRFQLKNRPTTAKVQQEYDKKCENNSRTENVCDVGVNKVLYVLFGLQTVFCPAFKMV